MSLLFTLFPLYLLGNLHCIGMCGPLAMLLGTHRYRNFYFLGRLASFTLAGAAAGEAGAVLGLFLNRYAISSGASFLFGVVMLLVGAYSLGGKTYPGYFWLSKKMKKTNQKLSLFLLKDRAWPAFLFGFFTLSLPCGQTILVFSACALAGDLWTGTLNGFAFASLTTPSLWLAMRACRWLQKSKKYYTTLLGIFSLFIGILAILRGLADRGAIPHLSFSSYHLILY